MEGASTPMQAPQQSKDHDAKLEQEEQMRRELLATVLDTAARERRMSRCYLSPRSHSDRLTHSRRSIPDIPRQSGTIQAN
jgi:DNA-binding TFAR19-related protein (PDSD5 family)